MNRALERLIELLKKFEGCRLHSYKDEAGIWTLGWGETAGIKEGMQWTQEQADSMLRRRAAWFLAETLRACPQLIHEPFTRQAACGSLCYNIGTGAWQNVCSVRRLTARREYAAAAEAFKRWNKAGGKVSRILTLRRGVECLEYLK
ncbi:MAG: lysozyme [Gallionella sp.]|jgi:lysozyme